MENLVGAIFTHSLRSNLHQTTKFSFNYY